MSLHVTCYIHGACNDYQCPVPGRFVLLAKIPTESPFEPLSSERFLLRQLFSYLHVSNREHSDFQQFVISDFGSSVVPGESVSSDTALGYNNEAELSMSPWPTCDEDPELSTPTDVVTDSDARHWLQLSPTDASNLTGNCIFERHQCYQLGLPEFPSCKNSRDPLAQ